MDRSVLSLCAGYGGLELAVALACPGSRVVAYVEREAHSAAVLLARMEDAALAPAPVWCGDLADLDASLFRGVGMVTAGFPCQPWSAAGQGRGFDDERWIWPDIARIVRDVGPRYVFLENVPGLLVRGGLGAVLGDLAEMGFDAEWGVLSAADAGASQLRERVYVLAYTVRSRGPEVARGAHGDEGADEGRASIDSHQPDGGGETLADSDDDGRSLLGWEPGHDGQPWHDADGPGRAALVMAHANGQAGRQQQGDGATCARTGPALQAGAPQPRRCGGDLGLFPPGPDDLGSWAEVLAIDPSLEPSLRRVADGPAGGVDGYDDPTRTDQLRALGNGVVPLAGALALRLLAERAGVTL